MCIDRIKRNSGWSFLGKRLDIIPTHFKLIHSYCGSKNGFLLHCLVHVEGILSSAHLLICIDRRKIQGIL
ncbi:hypothetical protein SUGI_0585230 [Cryptomeria japonica]|nr:hypothetical protein SUGI_0585230 [Cryptomeria japonica]